MERELKVKWVKENKATYLERRRKRERKKVGDSKQRKPNDKRDATGKKITEAKCPPYFELCRDDLTIDAKRRLLEFKKKTKHVTVSKEVNDVQTGWFSGSEVNSVWVENRKFLI